MLVHCYWQSSNFAIGTDTKVVSNITKVKEVNLFGSNDFVYSISFNERNDCLLAVTRDGVVHSFNFWLFFHNKKSWKDLSFSISYASFRSKLNQMAVLVFLYIVHYLGVRHNLGAWSSRLRVPSAKNLQKMIFTWLKFLFYIRYWLQYSVWSN